ncbi:MAG: hypothetical protein JXA79_12470, partial [Deltaproteobacteria bacterium]|nr:hypothetical protein [Deltaproteobacteria bacterium]
MPDPTKFYRSKSRDLQPSDVEKTAKTTIPEVLPNDELSVKGKTPSPSNDTLITPPPIMEAGPDPHVEYLA